MPSPRGALQSPGLVGEGRPVVGEDDEEEAETKKMLERNHPPGGRRQGRRRVPARPGPSTGSATRPVAPPRLGRLSSTS